MVTGTRPYGLSAGAVGQGPAPPSRAFPGLAIERYDPTHSLSMKVLLFFVFSSFSRLPDFVGVHGIPFFAMTQALIALGLIAMSGRLLDAIKSLPGMTLLALTSWMFLGLPFSVFPSGAFDVVTDIWLKSIAVFYLIAGGALWFSDTRRILLSVAFATAAINVFAFRYGYLHFGRLAVGGGTFSNPNDLAIYLVTGIPFCAYALLRAKSKPRKLFWLATTLIALYYVSKTGSRGAMLAFGVGVLYTFWKSTGRQKASMVAAAAVVVVLAPMVIPPRVYVRYVAMFTDNVGLSPKEAAVAESSTQARLILLKKSIEVTRDNPVFGVGPGQFNIAAQVTHVSHNMYTQVSSETGIPGFLMYMAVVAFAARATGKVMRRTKRIPALADIYQGALTVRIAMIIYLAASFFGSVAYGIPVMILMGTAEALGKTAEREIEARRATAAAAAPVPPAAPRRLALA